MKQIYFVMVLLLAAIQYNLIAQKAYDFNGTNQYVTFGIADSLGATLFTLECWFYKKEQVKQHRQAQDE